MKQTTCSIVLSLAIVVLTMGFQCDKDYIDIKPVYAFAEKLTLTPYKKIYSIHDTITVQFITTDKRLFDRLSQTRVATDTSQLMVGFYYHKRYPIFSQPEFFCEAIAENPLDFSFTTLYSWYNMVTYKTGCTSSGYFLKLSFIPLKTGIYSLQPFIVHDYCPEKLDRPFAETQFTFDLADCNKDVWLSIPPASRGGETGTTDLSIDKKEIFVFKVQ